MALFQGGCGGGDRQVLRPMADAITGTPTNHPRWRHLVSCLLRKGLHLQVLSGPGALPNLPQKQMLATLTLSPRTPTLTVSCFCCEGRSPGPGSPHSGTHTGLPCWFLLGSHPIPLSSQPTRRVSSTHSLTELPNDFFKEYSKAGSGQAHRYPSWSNKACP